MSWDHAYVGKPVGRRKPGRGVSLSSTGVPRTGFCKTLGVSDGITVSWQFAFAVDSRHRLARGHAGTVKELFSIPFLGQVETIDGAPDINAEKEAECAHVFDSKLAAEAIDNVLEEA